MTRKERITKAINLSGGQGLELGPLTSPILSKEEASIFYVDHISEAELRKKYETEPVELEKIVPLDYSLDGRSLKDTVKGKKFDYIVASHVIEHIPNMVEWLQDVGAVLKTGGVLSLAIPDKRYTFDLERSVTQPAEVVGAYLDKVPKFTSASLYDATVKYAENVDSGKAWEGFYEENPPKHRWTQHEALVMCRENLQPGKYVDCHCFVFTPKSLLIILIELTELDLLDYELAYFLETQRGELEFYVSLKKVNANNANKKSALRRLRTALPKDKVDKLSAENEALHTQLDAVTGSLSWKITQPLRQLNKIIKR